MRLFEKIFGAKQTNVIENEIQEKRQPQKDNEEERQYKIDIIGSVGDGKPCIASVDKEKSISVWIKSCAAIGDGSSMLISANYVAEAVSGILTYKDTDYIQSSPSMEKINKCIR